MNIKQNSYPNSINLKSNGVTPVAVLGSEFFDVQNVVIDTVKFTGASVRKSAFEDANNDGYPDLILHFDTQSLKLRDTDTEAILAAQLNDGTL